MSGITLMTDFVVGLHNKSITETDMIHHLKKIGKSNGYLMFSIIVDKKYLKYIKKNYKSEPVDASEYWWYKNAVMVFPK